MVADRRTADDLASAYTDPAWRAGYLQLVNVVTLLRHSIIGESYRISDRMNNAIVLTDYGTRTQHLLTTKHDVPAKEARMACFLEIAHEEPLVDLGSTRIETVIEEIFKQILKGSIRYPFIYGGILYQRAADLFPDRRIQLNAEETKELLDGTPAGVYQTGRIVVGPLGVRVSKQWRWLPPENRVPLQHCSDVTCRRVHSTSLSTDYDAPINQHLPKLSKILDDAGVIRGAWTEFTGLLSEAEGLPYDDFNMSGVPVALGDCFTDDELVQIAERLDVSDEAAPNTRDRATLLQLIWLEEDLEIVRTVDSLVRSGSLEIPPSEIRQPRLAVVEVGSFSLRAEIGAHGVRLKPYSSELSHLRLTRLIGHLYDNNDDVDKAELLWQLRGVDGASLEDRLEEYLRVKPPADVVSTLVLARRRNVERALSDLRVDLGDIGLGDINPAEDDSVLVDKILWKLGFGQELQPSAAVDFLFRQREMRQVLRDAGVSAIMDVERIRQAGAGMFISLEGLLADSLGFSWWALTNDHITAARPFTYTPRLGERAWPALIKFQEDERSGEKIRLGEPRTLYPLGQSYALLARLLASLRTNEKDYLRSPESLPRWVEQTELKEFGFHHTIPFLDLTEQAQARLIEGLSHAARVLKDSNVHGIRNSMSHFQRSNSSIDDVERAVAGAGEVVESLEALGLVRVEYRLTRITVDQWSRSVIVMRSAGGDEVTFSRPSRVGFIGLPSPATPQYLLRAAVFGAPNEILRFRAGVDSPYSEMWSNFPRPRRAQRGRYALDTDTATRVAQASHGVLPQT
jgi:hypothetical protein